MDKCSTSLAPADKSGASAVFKAAAAHWDTLTVTDPNTGTVYPVMPLPIA